MWNLWPNLLQPGLQRFTLLCWRPHSQNLECFQIHPINQKPSKRTRRPSKNMDTKISEGFLEFPRKKVIRGKKISRDSQNYVPYLSRTNSLLCWWEAPKLKSRRSNGSSWGKLSLWYLRLLTMCLLIPFIMFTRPRHPKSMEFWSGNVNRVESNSFW